MCRLMSWDPLFPGKASVNSCGARGEDLADEFVGLDVVSVQGPPLLGGVGLAFVSAEADLLAVDRAPKHWRP